MKFLATFRTKMPKLKVIFLQSLISLTYEFCHIFVCNFLFDFLISSGTSYVIKVLLIFVQKKNFLYPSSSS